MPDLPTGTVTFLLTDIEGSTPLWEQHPAEMRQALVRHDALVEQIVAAYHGHVVRPRGEGDSRFAVFARASDAVAAAAALQRAFFAEPWPTPTPLRVRMALHTGEADLREGDYYGSTVNRCARLRAVAHGAQTLVSLTTEQLVREQLAASITLRDLGEHRLKDLQHIERVFQLSIDGVSGDFPPLKTLDARPNNPPVQLTSFVGREQEVEALRARVCDPQIRLLTLTAAGGSGKTRLALQVAAELVDTFADGVVFVALAPILQPDLVVPTIAQSLGIHGSPAQPLLESLKVHLASKQLLLVLDNFEQVAAAAPLVSELLAVAPHLKVLVTSREVLHLSGEYEVPLPPLALPPLMTTQAPNSGEDEPGVLLGQYEAVRLFIERAAAVNPTFGLTRENAAAVAEICHRLDGLPLAIELAAARVRLFSPQMLVSRLGNRLKVLVGGARDLHARQQTLRGTIDWSYNLLSPGERTLFARFSVFAGGWTLEAAETLCAIEEGAFDVVDGLESLVAKSLVRQQPGGANGSIRFMMLETIREYALERLVASGEHDELRDRHLVFFRTLAEQAEPYLRRAEQVRWLDDLEAEYANIRAALRWALERGSCEDGLRLASALQTFWHLRGHDRDGCEWLERLLATCTAVSRTVRARALVAALVFAWLLGDHVRARPWCEEALVLCRLVGDMPRVAEALWGLALMEPDPGRRDVLLDEALMVARQSGATWHTAFILWITSGAVAGRDEIREQALLDESLALFRQLGDAWGMGWTLMSLGDLARRQSDYDRAITLYEDALAQTTAVGHSAGIGGALMGLARVTLDSGDSARALPLVEEGLARFREAGHLINIAMLLCLRGHIAIAEGDYATATGAIEEALSHYQVLDDRAGIALARHLLGVVAQGQGEWGRAKLLLTEALLLRQRVAPYGVPESLAALADLVAVEASTEAELQHVVRAARLWGAAAAVREALGRRSPRINADAVAAARSMVDNATWETAWAKGQAMTLEQAIAYALEDGAHA